MTNDRVAWTDPSTPKERIGEILTAHVGQMVLVQRLSDKNGAEVWHGFLDEVILAYAGSAAMEYLRLFVSGRGETYIPQTNFQAAIKVVCGRDVLYEDPQMVSTWNQAYRVKKAKAKRNLSKRALFFHQNALLREYDISVD